MRECYKKGIQELMLWCKYTKWLGLSLILSFHVSYSFAQKEKLYKIEPIAAEKVPLNEKLSQGRVSDIIEDERGFMWIGTLDGLNRYDGYDVKIFRHKFNDSCSLDNNQIHKIVCSKDGFLWVLTKTGLNKFNTYSEKASRLTLPQNYQLNTTINDVEFDKSNNLWIASSEGLFLKKNQTDEIIKVELKGVDFEFSQILIDYKSNIWLAGRSSVVIKFQFSNNIIESYALPDFPNGNKGFQISDIHEDKEHNIWVADNNPNYSDFQIPNVFVKEKGSVQFRPYTDYNEVLKKQKKEAFFSEVRKFESRENQLWLVTTSQSIASIDFATNTFTYYPEHREFFYYREVDKKTLFFDSHENLWLGTNGQGAFILPDKKDLFKLVNTELEDQFYLKSIRAFYEDKESLWIGGYNGLIKMDKATKVFEPLVTRDIIYSIEKYPNDENVLILGTEGGGLKKVNINDNKLEDITCEWTGCDRSTRFYNWIFDIYNDGDSIYWCGAYNGIIAYHLNNTKAVLFESKKGDGFEYGNILNIYRDLKGHLMVGSDIAGLLLFNEELQKFQPYKSKYYPNFDFKSLRINHINQTPDSIYWISTDKGLLMMNRQEIKFVTKEDGLPNDFVYAAVFDGDNRLWISSNGGICSYQLDNGHVSTFSVNDGLQGLEFNTAAHYKAKDGTIYFGGVNGFNYFDPSNVYHENEEFPIVITGVYFNNKEYKPEYSNLSNLSFSIPPTVEYFKLEFASLNYVSAPQNRYKYKINEIHESWIDLGQENEIGFHGLDPGTYHLEILASDHHGSWSKDSMKIEFIVEAMIWETLWFKYGLALFILTLLFSTIFYRIKLLKIQKKKIENIVEERTRELSNVNQRLRKVNATKEKFLTIISHDIKNPLGAAQSVSDDLKENFDEYSEEERNTLLGIMCRSLNHLHDLITNLSSWSKLQHQEIKPRFEYCDLDYIIKENIELVAASLLNKELKIELRNQISSKLYVDCKMVDVILRNLISNAIKFSYPKSVIRISTMEDDSGINISIQDSGVGMSKEILDGLFSSERSQSLPGTANEKGTGFGLLMIKEFVKLNRGEINVESKEGEGSIFKLSFPVQKQK